MKWMERVKNIKSTRIINLTAVEILTNFIYLLIIYTLSKLVKMVANVHRVQVINDARKIKQLKFKN